MKNPVLIRLSFIGALLVMCPIMNPVRAELPLQLVTRQTVGVEYIMLSREQAVTEAAVNSEENLHALLVHYAPVKLIGFSLGLAADRFKVSEYQNRAFEGKYGLSPVAGIYAATPAFLKGMFRVCAETEIVYLNSRDDHQIRYSGPVLTPSIGISIKPAASFCFELGGRGHVINGTMSQSSDSASQPFSNNEYVRLFASLTAVSPAGVYLDLDFAAAPESFQDKFKNGLKESSIGFKVGLLLFREEPGRKKEVSTGNDLFPDFEELKARQKEMSKEIE